MKFILGIMLLAFALTGCSTFTPSVPAFKGTHGTPPPAKDIHQWQLSGKIGVQTAKDAGSANVNWTQRGNAFHIVLSGPFGSGSLLLTGQPGSVTMIAPDGKRSHASSPERLLASQWSFHIPVSNMRYWIRGLPVPGTPATTKYDDAGRLISLGQDGFHITYLNYIKRGKADLPEKLTISSSRLKVKMIVHDWKV